MNLLLLCLNSSILLYTGPQKCDRSIWLAVKFARRYKGIFKIHYTTGHFIPKKYLSLVFFDNRHLTISNPRNRNSISGIKSKFLFVSSMNTLLAILKVTDARQTRTQSLFMYFWGEGRLGVRLRQARIVTGWESGRERWSHTGRWTVRQISLPPPPPTPRSNGKSDKNVIFERPFLTNANTFISYLTFLKSPKNNQYQVPPCHNNAL